MDRCLPFIAVFQTPFQDALNDRFEILFDQNVFSVLALKYKKIKLN